MNNNKDHDYISKQEMRHTSIRLISALKEEYSLSQKEIATRIGCSQTDLSKVKNSEPSTLNEISREKWQSINHKLTTLLEELTSITYEPITPNSNHDDESNESDSISPHKKISYSALPENRKEFLIYSCIASTFIAFISIILLKDYLGYSTIEKKSFFKIIPLLFISHTLIGGWIGWTIYNQVLAYKKTKKKSIIIQYSALLFIGVFFLRGITSRDSYLLCSSTNEPCNGLLGQPNFELLATSLSLTICGFGIVKHVTSNNSYIQQRALKVSLYYAIISTLVFSLINEMYKLLLLFEIIEDKHHIISSAFFRFSFSHPERVPWIFLLSFMCMFLSLVGLKKRFYTKE